MHENQWRHNNNKCWRAGAAKKGGRRLSSRRWQLAQHRNNKKQQQHKSIISAGASGAGERSCANNAAQKQLTVMKNENVVAAKISSSHQALGAVIFDGIGWTLDDIISMWQRRSKTISKRKMKNRHRPSSRAWKSNNGVAAAGGISNLKKRHGSVWRQA